MCEQNAGPVQRWRCVGLCADIGNDLGEAVEIEGVRACYGEDRGLESVESRNEARDRKTPTMIVLRAIDVLKAGLCSKYRHRWRQKVDGFWSKGKNVNPILENMASK